MVKNLDVAQPGQSARYYSGNPTQQLEDFGKWLADIRGVEHHSPNPTKQLDEFGEWVAKQNGTQYFSGNPTKQLEDFGQWAASQSGREYHSGNPSKQLDEFGAWVKAQSGMGSKLDMLAQSMNAADKYELEQARARAGIDMSGLEGKNLSSEIGLSR